MKIYKKRRFTVIPLSSTSDIAFLLLIFIMLVALINYRKEVKIEYPEAKNQENVQAKKNFEIWVDEEGIVYYKGNSISSDQLKKYMTDELIKNPEMRIHVIADKNTKYKNVNDVIEILKDLQYGYVSLVVKEDLK